MLSSANLIEQYKIFSKPKTEIEHKTSHHANHAVLNVFETSKTTHSFDLQFDNPVVVSMIQGKKIMHLNNKQPFDFFPGQTIVMPASELMYIDFPEANSNKPTQCMALEIGKPFIDETLMWLNEEYPKADNQLWLWSTENFLMFNTPEFHSHVNNLLGVLIKNEFGRQLRAANLTKELVVNLLQTQARHFLLTQVNSLASHNRLAHVIKYIRKNLGRPIAVQELCKEACLSRAQFFRSFQRELGEAPVQFINKERIRLSQQHLLRTGVSIADACYQSGFNSLNYFCRIFKELTGLTPTQWRLNQKSSLMHKKALN